MTLPAPPSARPIVFAGPGVLAGGAVDALRRFAEHANVGVANSYTAKGLFPWDDPHHYGSIGLQRDDFTLAGFADAACIVAVGIDDDETPRARWSLAPTIDLDLEDLDAATASWPRWEGPLEPPPLYRMLAAVVQPLYADDSIPLSPARAIAGAAAALAPGDHVLTVPGRAGFWVARAFPTTEPGSVEVATRTPVAAGPAVRLAVTDSDPTRISGEVVVEVWGDEGDIESPADLDAARREALDVRARRVLQVRVDLAVTQRLIDVAGPVIAWRGRKLR